MLKAAIEKILSLDEPHIKSIEGRTYVDKNMTMIGKELRADGITMNTLSSLVDFIKKSTEDFKDGQYIVQVVSPTKVILFSSLDADRKRETLAVVEAEIPDFSLKTKSSLSECSPSSLMKMQRSMISLSSCSLPEM